MQKHFSVIIPVYGDAELVERSIDSAISQDYENKSIIICCDLVDSVKEKELASKYSKGISFIKSENTRLYALSNILRALMFVPSDSIVGILDGDDELIRSDCLSLISEEYSKGYGCVWTAHNWDLNGANQSAALDEEQDVYQQKWCASHFRTFLKNDFEKINKDNFRDQNGEIFKRTYDQALMLPILHYVLKTGRKTKYIPKNCYLYRGRTEWNTPGNQYQIQIEKFIRSRGYVE